MGKLYTVLRDSKYPAIDCLIYGIIDKLHEDLGNVSDNAKSGEYSLNEIAEQIDEIRDMIIRPDYEYEE